MIQAGLLLEKRWGKPEDVGNAVANAGTRRIALRPRFGSRAGRRVDPATTLSILSQDAHKLPLS